MGRNKDADNSPQERSTESREHTREDRVKESFEKRGGHVLPKVPTSKMPKVDTEPGAGGAKPVVDTAQQSGDKSNE